MLPVFMASYKLKLTHNKELLDDSEINDPKNIVLWIEEFETSLAKMGLENRGVLSRREILNWLVKSINSQNSLEDFIKEIGDIYQFLKQIDLFNFTSSMSKCFVMELEDRESIRGTKRITEKLLFSLFMKSELWNFYNGKYTNHFYLRKIRSHEFDEFIFLMTKSFNHFIKDVSIFTKEDITLIKDPLLKQKMKQMHDFSSKKLYDFIGGLADYYD